MKKPVNIIALILLIVTITACAPAPVPEPTSTPYPTKTATVAPTETITPVPTETEIPNLHVIRPIDINVPLYHEWGIPVEGDPAGNGHNGWDFGWLRCNPPTGTTLDSFPIYAIADGSVLRLGPDFLWLDHGIIHLNQPISEPLLDLYNLEDPYNVRLISQYGHVAPLDSINLNDEIEQGTQVSRMLDCSESGYFPELELQIIVADPVITNKLSGDSLINYLINEHARLGGEYANIDPILIGNFDSP